MSYCELHCCSAFSFLRGGSFPEQLAEVAAELKMPAIALLDRNGVYGAQRFSVAAREHGVRPIIGAELSMEDGSILPVLVENCTGYKNLCELLTQAHLRNEKGKCPVQWEELAAFAEGLVALLGSARVSRAGEGVLAIVNFSRRAKSLSSCEGFERLFRRDAETNIRDGCATQKCHQAVGEFRHLIPMHRAFAFFAAQMRLGQQFAQVFIADAIFHQHWKNAAVFH